MSQPESREPGPVSPPSPPCRLTHAYGRAVAGRAGAHVVVGHHVHLVVLAAVQVVKGAGAVVGEANVGVAVVRDGHGRVGVGAVAEGPADRAEVVLALHEGLNVVGRARG